MTHALKDVLKKYAEDKKAPEVTKLPAEPPKMAHSVKEATPMANEGPWPVSVHLDDKQFPTLAKLEKGQMLLLLAKVEEVITHTRTENGGKPEKSGHARLIVTEVSKL